jgi:hypothetical protein
MIRSNFINLHTTFINGRVATEILGDNETLHLRRSLDGGVNQDDMDVKTSTNEGLTSGCGDKNEDSRRLLSLNMGLA